MFFPVPLLKGQIEDILGSKQKKKKTQKLQTVRKHTDASKSNTQSDFKLERSPITSMIAPRMGDGSQSLKAFQLQEAPTTLHQKLNIIKKKKTEFPFEKS